MTIGWKVIESGSLPPDVIMAKDAALLNEIQSEIILHLYEWDRPCLTIGYFIDPAKHLHLDQLNRYGLSMARRPTGGGIIFHLTDFAFSILFPASHPSISSNVVENYAFVNEGISKVLKVYRPNFFDPHLLSPHFSETPGPFCMAKPTIYDLMSGNKKIGGAAQRRTKNGVLHQGSISLTFPSEELLCQILKDPVEVIAAMKMQSGCMVEEGVSSLLKARKELKELLKTILPSYF